MIEHDIIINWEWTKESLLKKERITPDSDGAIFSGASEMLDKAKALAMPGAGTLKTLAGAFSDGIIKLDGDTDLCSNALSSHLKGADHVYLFLATIGSAVEDEASLLMKRGDSLSGYLLDRIGSFAVESLANKVEEILRKEYEKAGMSVSMRFSPGYCDWPVEEQSKLDRVLDFSKLGVRLTESCMMVPKKSISGIIGIGSKGLFSKSRSQCSICNMKDCGYRRI